MGKRKKYIKALVKVTSEESYAEDFRNGKLYMNELRYFTKCEKRELEDKLETRAASIVYQKMYINFIDAMELCRPVFCMYGLYDTKHGNTQFVSICDKMKHLGKYAVVITNVAEFLRRLDRTGVEYSPIKYQNIDKRDPDSLMPYNPIYRKIEYFKYQQEFRIVKPNLYLTRNSIEKYSKFPTSDDDHYKLFVPEGLQDITSPILPIEQLLFPTRYDVDLTVDWNSVSCSNFIKYENPCLDRKEG